MVCKSWILRIYHMLMLLKINFRKKLIVIQPFLKYFDFDLLDVNGLVNSENVSIIVPELVELLTFLTCFDTYKRDIVERGVQNLRILYQLAQSGKPEPKKSEKNC